MAGVWMKHPDLPPEQMIEVQEQSVPHYQAAGWSVTDAPVKPARKPAPVVGADESVPAVAVEENNEPALEKPARRRAPKESDEK
jgi:hypothetical protein